MLPSADLQPLKFGPFTLDPHRRQLLHGDDPVNLTPKQFEVLEFMVQNANRVLTKQEIMQAVWPDSFVEEGNLSQNIFWLRKALKNGDDSEQDRYILTVQGRGYRFIAPVLPATIESVPAEPESPALPTPTPRRNRTLLLTLPVVLAAVAAAGLYYRHLHPSHDTHFYDAVKNPEVIIVAIQNSTDDPGLTAAINSALRRGVSQSPFVTIVPRAEINKTLGYMQLPLDTAVTPSNAQAICLRRNSTAIIETSIVPQGKEFLLTLEAVNCVTGKPQSVGRATAPSKDQILLVLDSMLPQLRRDLGESANSVRQFSVALENATTGSLEAFRSFLTAEDLRFTENLKAIPHYQRAIQLDPNFALAHLGLATAYDSIGERALSRTEFTRAYELSGRCSPREGFYIQYFYVKNVLGDLPAAIPLATKWETDFPRDPSSWLNATDTYNQLDRYQDAIASGEKGLNLFPGNGLLYGALSQAYLRAGRYDDTKRLGEHAISIHLDGWSLREFLWQRALLAHDTADATTQRNWVNGSPEEYFAISDDVLVALQQGKVSAAMAAQKRLVPAARALNSDDVANLSTGRLVFALTELGLAPQARTYLKAWHAKDVFPDLAIAYANLGEAAPAQAFLDARTQGYEQNTLINQWQAPIIHAALALHAGDPAAALNSLQATGPLNLHDFTASYLRGKAYLALHKGPEAAAAFQHIVDNPGADPFSPLYPLSLLGLARAKSMAGDAAASRAAYTQLLQRWQTADPTLPALLQARKEIAGLH